jgi:hypothetical protein
MPSRYQPLADYLVGQPARTVQVTLTLAEIEALLGVPLPPSAWRADWWSNTPTLRYNPWLSVGWRVTGRSFRLAVPTVTFTRVGATGEPAAPSG